MTIEDLLAETRTYLAPQHVEKIANAYGVADHVHKGVVHSSGRPHIQHSLEVALLLAQMRIDASGILAALLYDATAGATYTLEDVRAQFGEAVAAIVDGLTKFDALVEQPSRNGSLKDKDPLLSPHGVPSFYKRYQNSDTSFPSDDPKGRRDSGVSDGIRSSTVNKMLLSMAEEPRIVVLKIADCLHKMRTLESVSSVLQRITVSEAHQIYAPLAHRLGMGLVQAELEDHVFNYLEPEKYAQLARELEQEINRRQPFIDQVCQTLRDQMSRAGVHATVYFRSKHLASVQRKLEDIPQQQNGRTAIEKVQDLVLFCVLVDYDHDCYLALGHIHGLWRPKDGRIKDFIATPKLNGYQSLHTTVFVSNQQLAEIQVRTHDMERTANYGIANYWYLKDRTGKDASVSSGWRLSYREMRSWIELLREWQREQPQSADELLAGAPGDIFREQIFVFTPRGEVKYLSQGSTILDMAYRIHTDLGDHCVGGRIITNVDDSERLVTRLVPLDYQLKGGEIIDIVISPDAHPVQEWLSFARTAGARAKIKRYLKAYASTLHSSKEDVPVIQEDTAHTVVVPQPDENIQVVTLASCCCPFPGDSIVAVLTSDNELLVHGSDCRMLRPYYDSTQSIPTALVAVDWQKIQPEYYLVPITVVARDRGGLLRDVSAVITDANISLAEVRTSTTSSLQKTIITATLEIPATDEVTEQIESLFLRLREVMSVVSVERAREKSLSTTQDLSGYYWETYHSVVQQALIRHGMADPSIFPGVPLLFVDQVLERYIQAHPETHLEYQENAHTLHLKSADVVQRIDSLLEQIIHRIEDCTIDEHLEMCERYMGRILQDFSSFVGFGEVSEQDSEGFMAFSIDTRVVFENLRISHQLPVLVSFEIEMSDTSIEILRRLLLRRTPAPVSHVVVLLLFCDNHKLDQVKRRLAQTFSKTYAYDIAVINHEDILEIVSARNPERALRRVVLSQVSLSAVSPYKSQGPTPPHLFFGREHELREMTENATTTSYVLIGGRRIGKTSILKRLEHVNLPGAGFHALSHDCSITSTEHELIQAVTSNKQWFPSSPSPDTFSSFAAVIQSLTTEQPLVILLDEADKLVATDREIGYPVFHSLRALGNSGLCTFILSGEQALHTELTNPYSPLYNFASEMLIGRLDFPAVQELVIRPMKQLEILLQDEAEMVQRIWKFTSGHPSVVQSLCQRLIMRLHKHHLRRLTVDDVEAVASNYDFLRKDFLNVYWERATPLERLCSLIMVEDENVRTLAATHAALRRLDLDVTLNQVDEALECLVDLRNILQRTAGGYEFAVTALPLVVTRTGRPHDLIALNCETYRQYGSQEPYRKRGTV